MPLYRDFYEEESVDAEIRGKAARALVLANLAKTVSGAYGQLALLLGYTGSIAYMNNFNRDHRHVLQALAGPNCYAIYKILEARNAK